MKAVIVNNYKAVPEITECPIPQPKSDEVLIQTKAVAVNDFDWALVRGEPYAYRLIFGLTRPKVAIPGIELSGIVHSIGANVDGLKPGDAVYGDISKDGWGAFAEYVCVKKDSIYPMSEKMTFEEAAALPHAAMLAMQGLVDVGGIQSGESVLINGAGGGVGTMGLQFAKLYGAHVTGVDGGEKLALMRELGFDHVIDYRREDFTMGGKKYDLILDAKTTRAPSAYQRVLTANGRYITVGGNPWRLIQLLLSKVAGGSKRHIVSLRQNANLAYVNELFDQGLLKPVVDSTYSFDEVAKAIQYFGEGRHKGKVVLTV